jgi:hypothetical protein
LEDTEHVHVGKTFVMVAGSGGAIENDGNDTIAQSLGQLFQELVQKIFHAASIILLPVT